MKNIFKTLHLLYLNKFKPLKYAKKIGVNLTSENITLYGSISWGSEPWIITVRDNVFITHKVQF